MALLASAFGATEAASSIPLPAGGVLKTTFKGKLGYACLNTTLRAQKPSVFMSRGCTLNTIKTQGIQVAKDRALLNVQDGITMLDWNERHGIRFMRLSSDMFPFGSHQEHGYPLEFAAAELKRVGDHAKRLGHRLTFHPGQYTQLASPKEDVVVRAIRDLKMHAEILDLMGLDQDSVMVIHMGGVFESSAHADRAEAKAETLARFERTFETLPEYVQRRLVLENDDVSWSIEDLIGTCEKLSIPLVLDHHHNSIVHSSLPLLSYVPRVDAIWARRGIRPKQHLSDPAKPTGTPHQRRLHAYLVSRLPVEIDGWDGDLMVEAKGKERAVLALARRYGLWDVGEEWEVSGASSEAVANSSDHDKLEVNVAVPTPPKRGKKRKVEEQEDSSVENNTDATPPRPATRSTRRKKV
ncbi:UV-endonuclease UvdE [Gonapodya prolifera JEL478]|uniref:UV-endonuclease UvdE n=1 Tax=Gonapodya prolifera (strain JEL478) TaxID=1344416 RepID=A0A139A1E4_GONPJ|nr:UV-endonuclease UvdE [Gonapodya prolifera JEL478]|eukprot:KXS10554.1 UV-endonuclease UvdE [Gonapodya prolifera JEL478]